MTPRDLVEVEPGVYSAVLEGRSYEVRVVPRDVGYLVEIAGARLTVEIRDPRNGRRPTESGIGHGRQNVTAPMPGKVVRVLVQEGQEVEAGQGLLVVEAMKMQNEMKAAKSGTVGKVRARDGMTVAAGDVLVVIE